MKLKLLSMFFLLTTLLNNKVSASLVDELLTPENRFNQTAGFFSHDLNTEDQLIAWGEFEKALHTAMELTDVEKDTSKKEIDLSTKQSRLNETQSKVETYGPMNKELKRVLWANYEKSLYNALSLTYVSMEETLPSHSTTISNYSFNEPEVTNLQTSFSNIRIERENLPPPLETYDFGFVFGRSPFKDQAINVWNNHVYMQFYNAGGERQNGVRRLWHLGNKKIDSMNEWLNAFGNTEALNTVKNEFNIQLRKHVNFEIKEFNSHLETKRKSFSFF